MAEFDAFLLLSFGGPEGPDDVMPFLRNVTRGRGVPEDRLTEVAEHYHQFRGVSPINAGNRALIAALEAEFAAFDIELPIYWGNRNWKPYLADAVRQMRAESGWAPVLAFGGTLFTRHPDLAEKRGAVYLGPDASAAVRQLGALLSGGTAPGGAGA
jgi:ferrochelatase